MDFLLECIGFSPDWDLATVMGLVRERGEPTPWRGKAREHLTMPLAGGLELRLDQEPGLPPNLWPFYRSDLRRRVAVRELRGVEDSAGDLILVGKANPRALDFAPDDLDEEHDLTCYLTDAGRLPRSVAPGTVMAIVLAGFGLQVEYVGPNEISPGRYGFRPEGSLAAPPPDLTPPLADLPTNAIGEVDDAVLRALEGGGEGLSATPSSSPHVESLLRELAPGLPKSGAARHDVLDNPRGAALEFLGGPDSPAASLQISARIRTVSHLSNRLTGKPVNRIELDVPGMPIEVFVSPWQLEADGLPMPRPGWRIEGVFLMLGRNVGAVPRGRARSVAFG